MTDDFNSFMMTVTLPEGYIIPEDEYGFWVDVNAGRDKKTVDHQAAVGDNLSEDNTLFYIIAGFSLNLKPINTGDDLLLTITIEAENQDVMSRAMPVARITGIEFASMSDNVTPHYMPDMEFIISNGSESTGVENIVSDSEEECLTQIYDMMGRLVGNNPSPGYYIMIKDGNPTKVKL